MAEVMHLPDLTRQLLALPQHQLWTDYDDMADVLYISFHKLQQANGSIMEDDRNIYHYRDNELMNWSALRSRMRPNGRLTMIRKHDGVVL